MRKLLIMLLLVTMMVSLIPRESYAVDSDYLFKVEITAEPNLRVRDAAGTVGTERIGNLPFGVQVDVKKEVMAQGVVWYEIDFQGTSGYISSEYTKKVTAEEEITPPDPITDPEETIDPVEPVTNKGALGSFVTNNYDEISALANYEAPEVNEPVDPIDEEDPIEDEDPIDEEPGVITKPIYEKAKIKPVFTEIFLRPDGAQQGIVHQGEVFEITAQTKDAKGNTWYKVNYDIMSGYLKASDVTLEAPETPGDKVVSIATVTTDTLRVRSTPSTNGTILGTVSRNSVHNILGESRNSAGELWYKITYQGREGYISATYAKKTTETHRYVITPVKSESTPSKSRYTVTLSGGDYVHQSGSTISATASSTGFTSPQYRFKVSRNGYFTILREFGSSPSFSAPLDAGSYKLHVEVREAGATDVHQVEAMQHVVLGSNNVGLYSDSTSRNYFHHPIHFIAKSDVAGAQYQFSLSNGTILQRYSSSPYYKYTPSIEGEYTFVVTMKAPNGTETKDSQTILIRKLESEIDFRDLSGSSSNHYRGRNGWVPDMVVSHITEGSFSGSVSWLQNPQSQASSNFVIARDGRVVQLVDLRYGPWTNGTSQNPSSSVYDGKSESPIVRQRKDNANYYTMTIENEGVYRETRGAITEAQYKSNLAVLNYMRSELYRIYGRHLPFNRDRFTGHDVITPGTRSTDPGELYPFDQLIRDLGR